MSRRSLRRPFLIQKDRLGTTWPSSESEPRFLKIRALFRVVFRRTLPEKEILVNAHVFGKCVAAAVDNRLIAPAVPGLSDVCRHRWGCTISAHRDFARPLGGHAWEHEDLPPAA